MKQTRVFAPASIANMGCGFDTMGMAMDGAGDVVLMQLEQGNGIVIRNTSGVDLPDNPRENVVTPAIEALLAEYGRNAGRITLTIEKKIRPGSGIGSSAASSAAAVFALNELLDRPFTTEKLVEFAMEGEKLISGGVAHADNVAPALLGGVVLIRGYHPLDIIRLPVPPRFHCSVVHPQISVSTRMARNVLPKEIPLRDAVCQWGNVGGLVAGLSSSDVELVGRSMVDVVAEPYRKGFIPGFDDLRAKALEAGALAVNISGSGPAVFAVSADPATARRVCEVMKDHFGAIGIDSDVYVSDVGCKGARVI